MLWLLLMIFIYLLGVIGFTHLQLYRLENKVANITARLSFLEGSLAKEEREIGEIRKQADSVSDSVSGVLSGRVWHYTTEDGDHTACYTGGSFTDCWQPEPGADILTEQREWVRYRTGHPDAKRCEDIA
jgi:hypothetical protein